LPSHAGIQEPFQRPGGCRQWPTLEGLRENVRESDLDNFLEFSDITLHITTKMNIAMFASVDMI